MPQRVLICGGRNWTDRSAICREVSRLPLDSIIIHGACRGADTIAGDVARERGLRVESYPAEWSRYGRAAGAKRNSAMLATGVDRVLAFHTDLPRSAGTKDMVAKARAAGIPTTVFNR